MILVVDDELDWREFITDKLIRHGYGVTAVECGEKALEMIGSEDYQLIITDYEMYDRNDQKLMSGVELIRRIRETPNPPPVLMVSSSSRSTPEIEKLGVEFVDKGELTFPVFTNAVNKLIS